MTKTPVQEKLEAQRGKDIRAIVIEALEHFKGRRLIPQLVATDLGISNATFYNWCQQMGINIDHYRFPNDNDETDPEGAPDAATIQQ